MIGIVVALYQGGDFDLSYIPSTDQFFWFASTPFYIIIFFEAINFLLHSAKRKKDEKEKYFNDNSELK